MCKPLLRRFQMTRVDSTDRMKEKSGMWSAATEVDMATETQVME